MGAILVSGTPGTGKTTLAKELSKRINHKFMDIGELARSQHLYLKSDPKRDTKIIDERRLARKVENEIIESEGKVVASSHYAELVNPKLVDKVIVLRTHPDELRIRLTKRGWSAGKIQENLEAEILGVCSSNAIGRYGRERVYEIDTTKIPPEETLKVALEIIGSKSETHIVGSIDWLADLEKENKFDSYFLNK